jgi:aspartyl-tRNA(Asn)/glutamyl-tRNA(Gln) amidotransferase subunit A
MMDTITKPLAERELRGATLCQTLHWLASGRVSAGELCDTYLAAIARENPRLNAYVALNPQAANEARKTQTRRTSGPCGRLDGVPVSIKDNLDVAGLPTRSGLPATPAPAARDAHVVERLRHAGAVILGKTHVPEGTNARARTAYRRRAQSMAAGFQAGGSRRAALRLPPVCARSRSAPTVSVDPHPAAIAASTR